MIEDYDGGAEGDALVARLAAGPTRSYAGSPRQLTAWAYARLHEQLELAGQAIAAWADEVLRVGDA